MFLFILGATIGAFLMVLPDIVRAITTWVQGRRQAKLSQAVSAELARRAQAEADWVQGWDYVEPTDSPRFVPIQHP